MIFERNLHLHFVGVGGVGMSGIAEVLANLGYRVTGTDLHESEATRRLRAAGATIFTGGHDAAHLGDADVVVVSSAIPRGNPEVEAARARRIPVIPRAEMLAELMRLRRGVAVAGSHGKTTTTSLLAWLLHEAGADPTVVIGGKVNAFGSNARLGQGDLIVAEADESDGSFLVLSPTYAVVTNIDREHLDHYGTFEDLRAAFAGFVGRVPFYGAAYLCIDDPVVRSLVPEIGKRVVTYGLAEDAEVRAAGVTVEGTAVAFDLVRHGRHEGRFRLHMPGMHNVQNATGALALALDLGADPRVLQRGLERFAGVQRRFSVRGEAGGVLVVDDYGHHPTEIAATLQGARASFPERRLVAAIQPHRYTRLRDHFDAFVDALGPCDAVFVTEVYPAGETPIPGIDGASLARAIAAARPARPVEFVPEVERLAEALAGAARPGDLVLTLGAGSITRTSHDLVERIAGAA
ncbi:MAG: UDP-N-acetylmuramate--L-alanine ligase [Deltaproteobacteria bacterium]|nr:MAG: UDP-N-acetylmuramate--L-alanine ligase [Deltaproteobacteria bacterium]